VLIRTKSFFAKAPRYDYDNTAMPKAEIEKTADEIDCSTFQHETTKKIAVGYENQIKAQNNALLLLECAMYSGDVGTYSS